MAPNSILITRKTAAALLNISLGMLDKLARKGEIEPIRFGKKVLYRRDEIERLTLPPSRRRLLDDFDARAPLQ